MLTCRRWQGCCYSVGVGAARVAGIVVGEGSFVLDEQSRVEESAFMRAESEALKCAAQNALAQRRASGEIMTYIVDGWVVHYIR